MRYFLRFCHSNLQLSNSGATASTSVCPSCRPWCLRALDRLLGHSLSARVSALEPSVSRRMTEATPHCSPDNRTDKVPVLSKPRQSACEHAGICLTERNAVRITVSSQNPYKVLSLLQILHSALHVFGENFKGHVAQPPNYEVSTDKQSPFTFRGGLGFLVCKIWGLEKSKSEIHSGSNISWINSNM